MSPQLPAAALVVRRAAEHIARFFVEPPARAIIAPVAFGVQ
jgi:hypothetical protein